MCVCVLFIVFGIFSYYVVRVDFFCTLIDVWLLLPFVMDIYVEVWFEFKNSHNKSAKTNFNTFHWHSGHFMMIDRASDFIQMVTEIHINLFDTLTIYLSVVSSQKKTMCFSVFMQQTVKRWLLPSFSGYISWYSKLCLRPSFVLTQMICNQKTLSLWGIIPLGNGWWCRTFYLILSLFQPWELRANTLNRRKRRLPNRIVLNNRIIFLK